MSDTVYEETPSYKYPGWTRIQDGGAVKYRSPDGEVISNYEFVKRRSQGAVTVGNTALQEDVDEEEDANPESAFVPSEDKPVKTPLANKLFPKRKKFNSSKHPDPSAQNASRYRGFIGGDGKSSTPPNNMRQFHRKEEPQTFADTVVNILDDTESPKSKARGSSNRIGAKDVENGMQVAIDFVTSTVALFTGIPELYMHPTLNKQLSENVTFLLDKHNVLQSAPVRAVANSEEAVAWGKIGQVAYAYGSLAIPAVRAKIELMRAEAAFKRAQASQMNAAASQSVPRQHQQETPAPGANGYQASTQSAFMPSSNMIKPPPGVQPRVSSKFPCTE